MWDWLNSNSQLLVTLATLVGGYIWHHVVQTGRSNNASVLDSAKAAIGSVFDGYVATASTSMSLDAMRVDLRGLAAVQLGRLGIYEGTTLRVLADAAVSALIERAIAELVARHPAPMTLHAEVRAIPLGTVVSRA